jgi:hypothetical protein
LRRGREENSNVAGGVENSIYGKLQNGEIPNRQTRHSNTTPVKGEKIERQNLDALRRLSATTSHNAGKLRRAVVAAKLKMIAAQLMSAPVPVQN